MIRTFAALAALLTVGAVQAADMNMDMSGHEHHMMAGDHSMHMAAQSPAVQAVGVVKAIDAANGKVTIEHEPIAGLCRALIRRSPGLRAETQQRFSPLALAGKFLLDRPSSRHPSPGRRLSSYSPFLSAAQSPHRQND